MAGGRKFWAMWGGLGVTTLTALTGHMDGNVALCISITVGGFMGGNSYVTGKALEATPPATDVAKASA